MKSAIVFILLLFGVSWSWSYVARPLFIANDLESFLAGLLPAVWAPTILAMILILWEGGAAGLAQELRTGLSYRSGFGRWLILAGGLPLVITTMVILITREAGDDTPFISPNALPTTIGLQLITGALGEELGWRGYLLPRLGKHLGAMWAAIMMSVLWALWHVPAFFTPGMPHQFMPMAAFLIVIGCFGIFLALLFNATGASVLPAMLAHLALNVTLAVGGVNLSSALFWWTMAAFYGIVAIAGAVALRSMRCP